MSAFFQASQTSEKFTVALFFISSTFVVEFLAGLNEMESFV
jgi:hypothetical protein